MSIENDLMKLETCLRQSPETMPIEAEVAFYRLLNKSDSLKEQDIEIVEKFAIKYELIV